MRFRRNKTRKERTVFIGEESGDDKIEAAVEPHPTFVLDRIAPRDAPSR